MLARHGDESDLRQIRELLEWAWEEALVYDQCTLVDALHRLHDTRSIDRLGFIFAATPYSYLRKRCAAALSELSPRFGAGIAVECLWDCEAETRRLGVEKADRTTNVRVRLRTMDLDPTEDPNVRAVARDRR